jgi:hypothetical protein
VIILSERAAGGDAGEEGAVVGDAAPPPAEDAAAEHGLVGEEHEDLREGVVAQRVDAPAASIRRRRRHRSPSVVAVQKVAAGVSARFVLY